MAIIIAIIIANDRPTHRSRIEKSVRIPEELPESTRNVKVLNLSMKDVKLIIYLIEETIAINFNHDDDVGDVDDSVVSVC